MERKFEADTREEANRKADDWWAKAKGVRFILRSQIPASFRSNPSKRWVVAINYKEEASPSGAAVNSHPLLIRRGWRRPSHLLFH